MRVPQHIIVCMDDILDPKNIVQPVIHMMRFSAPPKTKIKAPIRDLDLTFFRKKGLNIDEMAITDWGTQSIFWNPKLYTEMAGHDRFRQPSILKSKKC